jgi:hypothetical protein
MSLTATFSPSEIVITRRSTRPEYNQEHITFDVPNGWDDVKKVCKKVLRFDGHSFTFIGWNSDSNECYFVRPLNRKVETAQFA